MIILTLASGLVARSQRGLAGLKDGRSEHAVPLLLDERMSTKRQC